MPVCSSFVPVFQLFFCTLLSGPLALDFPLVVFLLRRVQNMYYSKILGCLIIKQKIPAINFKVVITYNIIRIYIYNYA